MQLPIPFSSAFRCLRSALVLASGLSLAACATTSADQPKVTLSSGASVAYSLAGVPAKAAPSVAAEPLVVLQSGLGDGLSTWQSVADRVATRHAVFRYDRPGYGGSPSVAGPRDPCSVAQELHQVLQAAHLPPPYLLVGHSLGGLYHHAFARLYPEEVAGLLLLDPTHPDHFALMKVEAPAQAATVQALRWTLFGATARSEFDDQAGCRERLVGPPTRPVPTRLLVSTQRAPLEEGDFIPFLEQRRTDWLRLTGAPQIERVAQSGHYLQTDQPERVSQVIDAMVASASASSTTSPQP
jgi:pimeloyl-ACP methyl ester carboxylesterase